MSWTEWPCKCPILTILTKSEYHENLLSDNPLSLLSMVIFFSFLKTKMIQKIPNETFLRITWYFLPRPWMRISNLFTNQKQRLPGFWMRTNQVLSNQSWLRCTLQSKNMKHIFPRESISFKIVCPFIAQSVSWSVGCTMGRMTMKLTPWVTHLLAPHCSRRSRAPLRLFVHSLTRSFRSSWERSFCLSIECIDFIQIQPTVDPRLTGRLVFFPPPSPLFV